MNVRFPDRLKTQVEEVLRRLNESPGALGSASKNDIIVFAVDRLCSDILTLRNDAEGRGLSSETMVDNNKPSTPDPTALLSGQNRSLVLAGAGAITR